MGDAKKGGGSMSNASGEAAWISSSDKAHIKIHRKYKKTRVLIH